jgi:hypothetical protein
MNIWFLYFSEERGIYMVDMWKVEELRTMSAPSFAEAMAEKYGAPV